MISLHFAMMLPFSRTRWADGIGSDRCMAKQQQMQHDLAIKDGPSTHRLDTGSTTTGRGCPPQSPTSVRQPSTLLGALTPALTPHSTETARLGVAMPDRRTVTGVYVQPNQLGSQPPAWIELRPELGGLEGASSNLSPGPYGSRLWQICI